MIDIVYEWLFCECVCRAGGPATVIQGFPREYATPAVGPYLRHSVGPITNHTVCAFSLHSINRQYID